MSEPSRAHGADRVTLSLLTLACFFAVLALLGAQLGASAGRKPPHTTLVRKIYRTTIDEKVIGSASHGPSSSTSESRALGPASAEPAAVGTRTS
jgi:hypothetical protein